MRSRASTARPRRAAFRPRVVVMVKEARPGRVKTRLARALGDAGAAWLYRHMSASAIRRLAGCPCYDLVLAVTPDRARPAGSWARRLRSMPQGRGDLGRRMQRIMERSPPGPLLVVGTDIPAIAPVHLREAFRRLGDADAVLGPAGDGGYWLVGFRRRPRIPRGFRGVRWSSAHALADTIMSLGPIRIGFAATLADIDEAADLAAHRRRPSRLLFRFG